jgi:uncharacterized membrane protein
MDKMLVAIFEGESQAIAGSGALNDLHADASIVLYSVAVVAKDVAGAVSVRSSPAQGPLGTILGMATASLIELLGGALSLGVKDGEGAFSNPGLDDLAAVGTEIDFTDEVRLHFLPGTAGVIAEVDEDRITAVNRRLEQLGGKVFRGGRREVRGALIERGIAALQKEMQELSAEFSQATGENQNKLSSKIEDCRANLLLTTEQAKSRAMELRREAEAKIVFLQEQAATADQDTRAKLEERICVVRLDYAERARKLNEIWIVSKQSLGA